MIWAKLNCSWSWDRDDTICAFFVTSKKFNCVVWHSWHVSCSYWAHFEKTRRSTDQFWDFGDCVIYDSIYLCWFLYVGWLLNCSLVNFDSAWFFSKQEIPICCWQVPSMYHSQVLNKQHAGIGIVAFNSWNAQGDALAVGLENNDCVTCVSMVLFRNQRLLFWSEEFVAWGTIPNDQNSNR